MTVRSFGAIMTSDSGLSASREQDVRVRMHKLRMASIGMRYDLVYDSRTREAYGMHIRQMLVSV